MLILTARRRASAVYSVIVCPSVRPSQAGTVPKRLDERTDLAWVLPSTYPTLCYKENWAKTRVLPSVTLSHTTDSENLPMNLPVKKKLSIS